MSDTDSSELAIEVIDLKKSYHNKVAVDGVSFSVRRGEIFCLLGPNGAGKTTTVEILEGYRSADSGTTKVLNLDPASDRSKLKQSVGVVLQDAGLYPRIKVSEVVDYWRGLYPNPLSTQQSLELTDLSDSSNKLVRELSGGQRRRLDTSLALVGNPDLIFLDEPTTGFDPKARRQMWQMIQALSSEGKTVFLTTHYLDEAQQLADRVAILKDGRLIANNTPEGLASSSMQYTVQYLGPSGDKVSHSTDSPTELLNRLTSEALAENRELEDLSVTRPSLEDIYLELTEDE